MAKKLIYTIPLVLLALIAAVYFYISTNNETTDTKEVSETETAVHQGPSVIINDLVIPVDLANTPETRAQGLSGRERYAEVRGMFFDFGKLNSNQIFWMKDMKFDIDIIWIKDNKIDQITSDIPAPTPGTLEENLPKYRSNQPIDYVLEVNAGFARENGINVGDEVIFNF